MKQKINFQLGLIAALCFFLNNSAVAQNLLSNSGFESGTTSGLWGGSVISSSGQRSGTYCLKAEDDASGGGWEYTITGLSSNTTYILSGYFKGSASGTAGYLGVKSFGGAERSTKITATSYTYGSVTFTTGPLTYQATLYVWNPSGGVASVYADDMSLSKSSTSQYTLVFSDEFNTNGAYNTNKWVPEIGFQRNQEEQYYTSTNATVSGGALVITAKRETNLKNPNYVAGSSDWAKSRQYIDWTSSSLTTNGTYSWIYGRFEIRAKVSNLTGTWPAIWTLGTNYPTCGWPANGEVDIMENYGGNILANFVVSPSKWDSYKKSVSSLGTNWASNYHIWTLDWHYDRMAVFVDGVFLNDIDLNSSSAVNSGTVCNGQHPFRKAQYLLLNLAMGSTGGSTANLGSSTSYYIDYVRVYQESGNRAATQSGNEAANAENSIATSGLVVKQNPAKSKLNFTVRTERSMANQKPTLFRLLDLSGREMRRQSIRLNTFNDLSFDLNGLASGVYLLESQIGGKRKVNKVVVE